MTAKKVLSSLRARGVAKDIGLSRRGIALISVLWVLVLLSLMAASFTRITRGETNLTRNLVENAKAEALADAGVAEAVLGLSRTAAEGGWRADGSVYAWRFAGGEIRVAVEDEGGKIDLNAAQTELLQGLFDAAGLTAGDAAALADAVVDFRDANDLRQLNGAEDDDYSAAGLSYGAKDGPFARIEELRQVLGMTPRIYDLVAPGVTVYSGRGDPHAGTAPAIVAAALAGRSLETATEEAEPSDPDADPGEAEEAPALGEDVQLIREGSSDARSGIPVYRILSEGRTAGGAVFAREAVVRLTGNVQAPLYRHLWRQGPRTLFEAAVKDSE